MSNLFKFHALNESGIYRAEIIATCFDALLNELTQVCPEGRELALAKTKLEEACFFAKKAMACAAENQK